MKRHAGPLLLLLLLLSAATSDGLSYSRPRFLIGSEVKQSRWPTPASIPIIVNTDLPNSIVPGSQPFQAVRNAFETRSAYSSIRFAPVAGSFPENLGFDGKSVVTFKNTPSNQSVTAGFGAVTFFWFNIIAGQPVVSESDVAFNPLVGHTTTGSGGSDIENLGGHEVTHFLSLEHSALLSATAYPNFFGTDLTKRSLALDDLAGTEFLYPFADSASRTGALSGTVLEGLGTAVFGAQVAAVRESDGVVVSEISVIGGAWRIDALPPGDYTVYAEPFDGPCFPGLINDGIYGTIPFDTTLLTTYAGGNAAPTLFTVAAGSEVSAIGITALVSTITLNPRFLGLSPNATTPVLDTPAVAVAQGAAAFLTVAGVGLNLVPDDGLSVTGPGVNISSSGVVRGSASGNTYMIVSLTVDADAPPGARSIFADNGTRIGAITGGFEVLPAQPLPGLLRNDELTALAPVAPALSGLFPLDPVGPDAFPGIGEGTRRELAGSDDDDDLYVAEVPTGYLDPDQGVATDDARPLVFYQLTDPDAVLLLDLTPSGRIQITY